MPTAFILINTEVTAEQEVLEMLKSQPEVEEADLVYGIYDIVVKVKAETLESLKQITTNGLRNIKLIRSTMTMIAVD
jgi:DNA-binding Lrp family transcriptional regulator